MYGNRANQPPLNWDKPGQPVVRSVAGDSLPARTSSPNVRYFKVSLHKQDWREILSMLDAYTSTHGLDVWYDLVRPRLKLAAHAAESSYALDFSIDDWRTLYSRLQRFAQRQKRRSQFRSTLGLKISKQIKAQK
jgi:hypothetical protein